MEATGILKQITSFLFPAGVSFFLLPHDIWEFVVALCEVLAWFSTFIFMSSLTSIKFSSSFFLSSLVNILVGLHLILLV